MPVWRLSPRWLTCCPAWWRRWETLRALAPDLKRSKEEQKKQAGFI